MVVVMLLLFTVSCKKEVKEVVDVSFNPDSTFTMRSTDVTSLISDSGITRYRFKTKEWLVYDKATEPNWYFPQGVYIEKFDSLFHVEASIKADTAYNYTKKGLWKAIGNVYVESLDGKKFSTSLLYWDQKEGKIYSDKYVQIEEIDKVITGIGFESNQEMTKYKIFQSTGIFPVNEAPADSVHTNPTDSVSFESNAPSVAMKADSVKVP